MFRANEAFTTLSCRRGRHVPQSASCRRPHHPCRCRRQSTRLCVGMTNFQLAQALVRLGAVTAMALDGGGSMTMAFDGARSTDSWPGASARSPPAPVLVQRRFLPRADGRLAGRRRCRRRARLRYRSSVHRRRIVTCRRRTVPSLTRRRPHANRGATSSCFLRRRRCPPPAPVPPPLAPSGSGADTGAGPVPVPGTDTAGPRPEAATSPSTSPRVIAASVPTRPAAADGRSRSRRSTMSGEASSMSQPLQGQHVDRLSKVARMCSSRRQVATSRSLAGGAGGRGPVTVET